MKHPILVVRAELQFWCYWFLVSAHISFFNKLISFTTVMTLSFRTDKSGQTVQTQIRLIQEEQSDQDLHCLLFHLHHYDKIPLKVWLLSLNFRKITSKISAVPKFRNFTVFSEKLTKASALQPISRDLINIFERAGSRGNSTMFLPNGFREPVLSRAPRIQSWYMELRILS